MAKNTANFTFVEIQETSPPHLVVRGPGPAICTEVDVATNCQLPGGLLSLLSTLGSYEAIGQRRKHFVLSQDAIQFSATTDLYPPKLQYPEG